MRVVDINASPTVRVEDMEEEIALTPGQWRRERTQPLGEISFVEDEIDDEPEEDNMSLDELIEQRRIDMERRRAAEQERIMMEMLNDINMVVNTNNVRTTYETYGTTETSAPTTTTATRRFTPGDFSIR